jgi:hypothetical protein
MTTQSLTKEFIRTKIAQDNRWAIHGLKALYARQTSEEQSTGTTSEDNHMGFNGVDAPFASSLVSQLEAGRFLSEKQMAALKKMLMKYAGQLLQIAEANTTEKKSPANNGEIK